LNCANDEAANIGRVQAGIGVESLRGVYPILATPFDAAGRIDVEVLRHEVEYLVSAGVDGVGVALASEVPMLTEAERDLVLQMVVAQARDRVKVVMNTSAPGTDLAVYYSRRAEELGADAVMVLPPASSTTSETIDYFARIAEATDLPIFIQDIANSPVPPGLAAQIASTTSHAWYLKAETPPTPPRVTEVLALASDRITVFGGAGGGFFIEELRRGSVGTMPGSAIPEAFVHAWKLAQAGKLDDAETAFALYQSLLRLLGQGQGIGFYLTKEVLRLRGVFTHTDVRRPAVKPDALAYDEIRRHVDALGLARSPVSL
jgi:dihydrodipicolinate synthase/N-acetylneuraminate lyase